MKISMLGYMGSGKTTIGKELADRLKVKFIDLDEWIEMKNEISITEIFKSQGEIRFRKSERDALVEILDQNDDFVLALGGGTPAYYDNIQLINEKTTSIYLRMSPPELVQRLSSETELRPLLSHLNAEDMPEFIAKHLFDRRSFYDQAKITVDLKNKTVVEIVDEIIRALPHP